jgi:hypothetical protein
VKRFVSLGKTVIAYLSAAVIGVTVAAVFSGAQPAYAWNHTAYVYQGVGMSSSSPTHYCYAWGTIAGWDACWHNNEVSGTYYAIDINIGGGGATDAAVVYWNWDTFSNNSQFGGLRLSHSTAVCHNIYILVNLNGSNFEAFHYVHLVAYANVLGYSDTSSYIVPGYEHYWKAMGEVLPTHHDVDGDGLDDEENSGCPWTAAHLHHSGNGTTGYNPVYPNTPTGAWKNNMFWLQWQ